VCKGLQEFLAAPVAQVTWCVDSAFGQVIAPDVKMQARMA
jgi:hypothetical protein